MSDSDDDMPPPLEDMTSQVQAYQEKINKAGSSIGWDTETDGLGGAVDD